jgi:hypothetical protein
MFGQVDYRTIKKGDRLYECSQYGSLEIEITTEPQLKGKEWTCKGRTPRGEVDLLINTEYRHYGPRFYTEPIYLPVEKLAPAQLTPPKGH